MSRFCVFCDCVKPACLLSGWKQQTNTKPHAASPDETFCHLIRASPSVSSAQEGGDGGPPSTDRPGLGPGVGTQKPSWRSGTKGKEIRGRLIISSTPSTELAGWPV